MIKIAPSILSADFSRLGQEVERLDREGADWIHVDIMDGVFVPNLTIGPGVVRAIRPFSHLPFDVHLMIVDPERYLKVFAEAGADLITVHAEATDDVHRCIETVHALGKKAGLSINPETAFDAATPYIDELDLLLIMTVHPGFGGQTFIHDCVPR
jgi:ribulose-phosphate 3-epimerase